MKMCFEKYFPYILSVVIMVGLYYFNILETRNISDNLLISMITVAAIIIGFLSTMLAILATISSSRIMQLIRKQKVVDLLYRYFKEAIYLGFIAIAISILVLMFPSILCFMIAYLWFLAILCFMFSSFRIINFMLIIIKNVISYDNSDENGEVMKQGFGMPEEGKLHYDD